MLACIFICSGLCCSGVDVPDEFTGAVIEKLSQRKGEMLNMKPITGGYTRLEFNIPSRGLIGYRGEFMTDTKGNGIINTIFNGYAPYKGEIAYRKLGSLIAFETGESVTYGLFSAQDRGTLFIGPGEKVYAGMVIGSSSRAEDIFPFIRDAMLRFRMGEEKWSVSSLTNYKMVRSMAWLYHNTKDAVNEFSKKYNCDLALAEEYLKVVRGIRNQQPFYVTDEDGEETGEDVALDDSWNYTDILWNGIQAEKVQRAFEKLNYREQTLLEKRLAICMTCGRVSSWKDRPTFEELAVMFEGSTASGAERAYRKAVDKLTELLVAEGAIHAVRLKQKSKIKRKKKIAAAIYEYQADCDGEWGEISLDFENGKAEVILLADWDTVKTNKFASRAIAYLLNCENEKLPKEIMVAFE